MSNDWVRDIAEMHEKFGFNNTVESFKPEKLQAMLEFRYKFLLEEMNELGDAISEQNPEEIVDALIDLCVVAIGTLDLYNVDGHAAWNQVHEANTNKERGVKASRPNPLGLPDLVKPPGWSGPDHNGNHGLLNDIWESENK